MTSPAAHQNIRVKLENSQLLLISGADAGKFLQGQVTCDVRELANPITRLGTQCNPKGRILLSFRALQMDAETIALRIPTSMLDKAKVSLGKYIVFSKAKLVDARDRYQLLGLYGETADEVAAQWFGKLPAEIDGWVEKDGSYLIQLAANRYECWMSSEHIERITQGFAAQTVEQDINAWQLLDIQAGIASIIPETIELFTPQEINYQLIGGVNFRKGCYTGQEIVARLHYRGKLKRHMYRFASIGQTLPAPGSVLVNSKTQQACGHLVAAASTEGNSFEMLVSLLDEQLDEVQLEGRPEKLSLMPLPYAIPTAEEKTE
ncbi:folate-binding protein YgfZ [Cellvibrio sp. pealriver]|uniref:CAF17-like 4Fe-4S cluster assembly/insertion protein YgfZ n=1 Tax=Cellvibrio sp. pealriver TaxID=1622269 RepID=UPI00066FF356|nr:folate-binding protein YgfZ [Cellvibrio sp. pealriver]